MIRGESNVLLGLSQRETERTAINTQNTRAPRMNFFARAAAAIGKRLFSDRVTPVGYPKGEQPEAAHQLATTATTVRVKAPETIAVTHDDINFRLPADILALYGKRGPMAIMEAFAEVASAHAMQKMLPPTDSQDLKDSRDLYVAQLMNQYTFPLLEGSSMPRFLPGHEATEESVVFESPTRYSMSEEESQVLLGRYRRLREVYLASKSSIDALIKNEPKKKGLPEWERKAILQRSLEKAQAWVNSNPQLIYTPLTQARPPK